MLRPAILLILLVYAYGSIAQVKFSFMPSEKHAQKLSRIKDGKQKLDKYYKYKSKAEKKHHKHYLDSMKRLPKKHLPDSSDLVFLTLPDSASARDSLTWALNTLAHNKQFDEIESFLNEYPLRDSLCQLRIDTAALNPILESRVATLTSELGLPEQEDPFAELSAFKKGPPTEGIDDLDISKDPKEQVADFQSRVKDEEMAKAQLRMAVLKKKYISIPDLSKPEEGVKRNSLEGKPLLERIYFGGNVSVVSTAPIALDVDLKVGYKLNRQLVVGAGVLWREAFYLKKDSVLAQPKAAHGYSGFVRYKFGKGFYTMAEYATIKNQPLFHESTALSSWQKEYLLGIGREFSMSKYVDITTTILYDFNYNHNDLHPRPFIIRIGYTINKPSFKKNKN